VECTAITCDDALFVVKASVCVMFHSFVSVQEMFWNFADNFVFLIETLNDVAYKSLQK